jgi:hypothetical protein
MKVLVKLYSVIGWQGVLCILIFVCVFIWAKVQHNAIDKSPLYTKGVSLGLKKGARGSMYLHYTFLTSSGYYENHVDDNFCGQCHCCNTGYTVIVKYEKGNPDNSDLILELPADAHFEDNP